jgi:hypothetical protein
LKIINDTEDAGRAMMELMEKVTPEDGVMVLQHPERWSDEASAFLSLMFREAHEKLATVSCQHFYELSACSKLLSTSF